jgi:hypothetical protein
MMQARRNRILAELEANFDAQRKMDVHSRAISDAKGIISNAMDVYSCAE